MDRRVLIIMASLALSACGASHDYWGARIDEMPDWKAVRCRDALWKANRPDIITFCPPGMPFPI